MHPKSKNLAFILFLVFCIILPSYAKTSDFELLKSMLGARTQEPRIYLPSIGFLGSKIEVVVLAPGAKKIILLAANQSGTSSYSGLDLQLGADYQELASSTSPKASFVIDLDPRTNKNPLVQNFDFSGEKPNNIFFEALAFYEGADGQESIKHAIFYGANANFTNQNLVQVKLPAKDGASVSSMARNFLPGLMRASSGNSIY